MEERDLNESVRIIRGQLREVGAAKLLIGSMSLTTALIAKLEDKGILSKADVKEIMRRGAVVEALITSKKVG